MQVVFTPTATRRAARTSPTGPRTSRSPRSATRASTRSPGSTDTSQGRPLRLPADRGGRHVVPVPDPVRRQAGPQPAAVGRDARQDLHQPDHQLGRPGDHRGQQRPRAAVAADHPGRAVRGLRRDRAAHALLRDRVPEHLAAVLRAQGHRPSTSRGEGAPDRAERLGRRDELRLVEGGQRLDRLRRVLLRAEPELPGREAAEQGRLLHAADPVQRRGRAEKAQINMDKSSPNYLLQNLNNVYTDPDPRTYPLSSYVYMIVPTGTYPRQRSKITTAKRQTHRRLHLLLDLPGPAGDRPDRLLAAAGQPGRGRLRPDRQAEAGRPASTSPTATSAPATTRPSSRATRTRTTWPRSPRSRRPATRSVPVRALPASRRPAPATTDVDDQVARPQHRPTDPAATATTGGTPAAAAPARRQRRRPEPARRRPAGAVRRPARGIDPTTGQLVTRTRALATTADAPRDRRRPAWPATASSHSDGDRSRRSPSCC